MLDPIEEQRELEEQAIALKWQNDTKFLRRSLKYSVPDKLPALRDAKYFAEEFIPSIKLGHTLSDVIYAAFIQDLPYSKWQTGAIQNAKKLLPGSQKKMLYRWRKERKKLFEKDAYFSKGTILTHLAVARVYAILNNPQLNENNSTQPPVFTNDTLLSLARALPFFDETPTWSEKAQKRLMNVLVQHISQNLAQKPSTERCGFVVRKLAASIIPEQNPKRTLFMIKMLGAICDTFGDHPDKTALNLTINTLTHQKQYDAVKQIRQSFHMDPIPLPTRLFKFFSRSKDNSN